MKQDDDQLDYSAIRRVERPYHRLEFKDGNLPKPAVFWLRRPLQPDIDRAEKGARLLVATYVTGGFELPSGEWSKDPILYPAVDGEPVELEDVTIVEISKIFEMQPRDKTRRRSFHEIVTLMVGGPDAFEGLRRAAELMLRGIYDDRDWAGKALPGRPATPSDPSSGEDKSIPSRG